jgi:hypothetical protein
VLAPSEKFVKFLGVHMGQFPEMWELREDKSKREGVLLGGASTAYVRGMSGMSVAVPSWTLMEFLDMAAFKQGRATLTEHVKKQELEGPQRPSPEVVQAEPADANPAHKEDFTRLLNAAAQGQSKGD